VPFCTASLHTHFRHARIGSPCARTRPKPSHTTHREPERTRHETASNDGRDNSRMLTHEAVVTINARVETHAGGRHAKRAPRSIERSRFLTYNATHLQHTYLGANRPTLASWTASSFAPAHNPVSPQHPSLRFDICPSKNMHANQDHGRTKKLTRVGRLKPAHKEQTHCLAAVQPRVDVTMPKLGRHLQL